MYLRTLRVHIPYTGDQLVSTSRLWIAMLISTSFLEGEISNLYNFLQNKFCLLKRKIPGLLSCKVQRSKNINFFTSSDQDSIQFIYFLLPNIYSNGVGSQVLTIHSIHLVTSVKIFHQLNGKFKER